MDKVQRTMYKGQCTKDKGQRIRRRSYGALARQANFKARFPARLRLRRRDIALLNPARRIQYGGGYDEE